MPEPQIFLLHDVGEGLTEAEIVTWHVQVGDQVGVNDTLVVVETAKSVVELPSPFQGVVLELHAQEGETLPVGAPLVTVGAAAAEQAAERPPVLESKPVWEPAGASKTEVPPVLVGTGPRAAVERRVRLRRASGSTEMRRPPSPIEVTSDAETRIPVKGVRKAIAAATLRSATTAPHAAMWAQVDVTRATDLIQRLRQDRAWAEVRVSPLVIVARMVVLAVQRYPEINASWDEPAQEIVLKKALNLGVAAATPRGLVVPNIKDAGSMSLRDLASALDTTIARARAGKLSPEEMTGGTFTLTNVGSFGVDGAVPILNPPEAAILALGAIQQRPWVVDRVIEVRDVMTLSISIDHRLVDGELGANVLNHVIALLNDPARALL